MSNTEDHGLQICVLERGFVVVGYAQTDEKWLTVTDAKYVRQWGTSKGLGELAANGPLPGTILDEGGTIKVPFNSALIHLLECNEEAWKG